MRLKRNRSLGRFCLALSILAAGTLVASAQQYDVAQSYGGGMRAPSVSPMTPRMPEYRRPPSEGRYTIQSAPSNPEQRKPVRTVKPVEHPKPAKAEPVARATKAQPPQGPSRAATGAPPAGERRFNPNEVVIEVAGQPTPQQVDALARRHRLNREESQSFDLSGTTMFRWTIPDGRSVQTVIRSLEADTSILSVQPNYRYTLQQAKSGEGIQYAVEKLRLSRAHELSRGDRVLVAVIDSGIDPSHPELEGTIADSFNPAGGDGAPHAHGTGIAGAIVAHSRLTGVAPGARILAVRAFDPQGATAEGTTFNILKGLEWAVGKGARIVNMSFAGPQDPILSRTLAAAHKRGIVLIAAAGNSGPKSPPLFPAADPNVIAVTATDAQDRLFAQSNRGNHVAVSAPGVDVLLPTPGASYQMSSGTSFAAAHVSGVAALVLQRDPRLSPDSVRRVLLSTARDLGPAGRDKDYGEGITDAYEALISLGAKPADGLSASRSD